MCVGFYYPDGKLHLPVRVKIMTECYFITPLDDHCAVIMHCVFIIFPYMMVNSPHSDEEIQNTDDINLSENYMTFVLNIHH